jgi:hypothetical protein
MGLSDFLFGSGALKKAASTGGSDAKDTSAPQPAGLDMAGLAQESATRQKAQESAPKPSKSSSPLSSTMTPISPKKAK